MILYKIILLLIFRFINKGNRKSNFDYLPINPFVNLRSLTKSPISPHTRTMDEHDNGKKEKTWFPLESNPDLLNSYISNLGFSTKRYSFTDVYSTEDWALDLIPHPVLALIVLFPMTEKVVKRRGEMHANSLDCDDESNVWYMKQRIRNACGTIG